MKTIFLYSLKRSLGSILGWGLSLSAMGAFLMSFYPTLVGQAEQMLALVQQYPPEMMALFGDMNLLFTPHGYIHIEFFSYMPLIVGIYAVLIGSGLISGDEENGVLDLVLAHPVSRRAVFWGRVLAFWISLLGILMISYLGFVLFLPTAFDVTLEHLALPFLSLFAVIAFFGTLALLLSLVLPSRKLASAVTGLLLVASYFISSFARLDENLEKVADFSPLTYYQGGYALNEMNWRYFGLLVGLAAFLGLAAWLLFERRDIRVGGEAGWSIPGLRLKSRGTTTLLVVAGLFLWTGCNSRAGTPEVATVEGSSFEEQLATIVAATSTAEAAETPVSTSGSDQMRRVTYQGVSFVYDGATYASIEGQNRRLDAWIPLHLWGAGEVFPPRSETLWDSLQFTFTETVPVISGKTGAMSIFPVRDETGQFLAGMNSAITLPLDQLSQRLQHTGEAVDFFPDADDFRFDTHERRLSFQNGEGIRAVVLEADVFGAYAVRNRDLFYVFEGLTADGRYYVSLRLPVSASALDDLPTLTPQEVEAYNADPEAFTAYRQAMADLLNGLTGNDFQPSLNELDVLVSSLVLQPALSEPVAGCTHAAVLESATPAGRIVVVPGTAFSQAWRVRNTGTCDWQPAYSLFLESGEALGSPGMVTLNQTVPAGGSVTLALSLTTPTTEGEYLAHWKLKSAQGKVFGLNEEQNSPLVVHLLVFAGETLPDLGTPAHVDPFETNQGAWVLGPDRFTDFELQNGSMVMTSLQSAGDIWRLFFGPQPATLYLEVDFTTGASCSGKDSYGVIVRAPEAEDNIYDSGYVFGFACDGSYRLYRMDDGEYSSLVPWTSSTYIESGPNQTNTLGIWTRGETIRLYVDGLLLNEVYDSSFSQGKFGLFVRSVDTAGFSVAVSELRYWTDLP